MMRLAILSAVLATGCMVGDLGSGPDPTPPTGSQGGSGNGGDTSQPSVNPPGPLQPGKSAFVLAHGFSGSAQSFEDAIVAAIQAEGHQVIRTEVPGVESVAVRAAALGPQIDRFIATTGATKVHIIAHSMGGLDARYLISKLGYADKVASLTTVSTPHQGTALADLALGIITSADATQQDALDAVEKLVGSGIDPAALNRALVDLSEHQAATFNAATPDAPGVAYESYAGLATLFGGSSANAPTACLPGQGVPATAVPSPGTLRAYLVATAPVVGHEDQKLPNDGVVGVASGKWGTFQGCVPGDHLDMTEGVDDAAIDIPTFYATMAARLAQ